MDLLWNLWQQSLIRSAQDDADRAHSKAVDAVISAGALREKIDRLELVCQAMWELCRQSGIADDERLLKKIQEIDLRDGVEDGRINRVKSCSSCGRKMGERHKTCIYCGAKRLKKEAFD